MIKMTVKEFIFEVKDEILSYEELGKKKADEWESSFLKWLNNKNKEKKEVFCCIEDESQIFDIADEFYYANEQNSVETYWKNFRQKIQFK